MNKHVFSVVIASLLLIYVHARESTHSSSPGTDSSVVDKSSSQFTRSSLPESAVNQQWATSKMFRSSSHKVSTAKTMHPENFDISFPSPALKLPSPTFIAADVRASSASPESLHSTGRHITETNAADRASDDDVRTAGEASLSTLSRSNFKSPRISSTETIVSAATESSSSPSTAFENASHSTASVGLINDTPNIYALGKMTRNSNRCAVQGNAPQLSSDRKKDAAAPSSTVTSLGEIATDKIITNKQDIKVNKPNSDPTATKLKGTVWYVCTVLGVGGLVSAFASARKRKRDLTNTMQESSKACVMTPLSSHRVTLELPTRISHVRVIFNGDNIAYL